MMPVNVLIKMRRQKDAPPVMVDWIITAENPLTITHELNKEFYVTLLTVDAESYSEGCDKIEKHLELPYYNWLLKFKGQAAVEKNNDNLD